MSTILEELTDKAMLLPVEEREMLIDRLIQANGDLPPMEVEVQAEALRRLEELESGQAQPQSHEEVMRRLRAKFPSCA